jgi:hypothetical protein
MTVMVLVMQRPLPTLKLPATMPKPKTNSSFVSCRSVEQT